MRRFINASLIFLFVFSVTAAAQPDNSMKQYRNRSLPAEARAADLLKHLTLEEKASLLMYESSAVKRLDIKQYNWWNEALHGVARNGSATVFPQPVGMASSFDDALLLEVFTAVSDEARVKYRMAARDGEIDRYEGITFWTPNINIFRDPRWGRGMETYGEDPYLTAVLGSAVVRGLQGTGKDVLKTHACAKHYAVHSGPEFNRHSYNAVVSERDLRETYLPAFKELVTKAGVKEVMTAYNRFEGTPCGSSSKLVKDILRGEWGFQGLVVSDCWALNDFYEKGRHNFVETPAAAAAAAVKNGMNVECGETFKYIPEAVRQGLLTEEEVDDCLFLQLVERYRLGEMDGVSEWDGLSEDIVEGEEHRGLSLRMARESMVLLQNKDGVLPLAKDVKVALIGPNADDVEMMWGNYNAIPHQTTTLRAALADRLGDALVYDRACGILDSKYVLESTHGMDLTGITEEQIEALAQRYAVSPNEIRNMARQFNRMKDNFYPDPDIPALLSKLADVDVVIFAGGISPRLEGEEMPVKCPGFASGDRTDIELPDVQRRVLKALHEAGKKIVLVNFSGSAMGLVPETESCDAILQAWYPGQEGGTAIAEVLYGEVNPSGKLPVTFYRNVEQLPDFEDYNMEGHTYRYFRGTPLYPFGYGLSYTTFEYGKASVKKGELLFKLKNTGRKDGTETVQLYVSRSDDKKGPVKTLRAFRRVDVAAGKAVTVNIPLKDEMFEWWNPETGKMEIRHGEYVLHYGASSSDVKSVKYTF